MWALVTGASSGIGKDVAIYLSELGYNLILTSTKNSAKSLSLLKKSLSNKVQVQAITLDLSKEDSPFKLYNFCKSKNVEILVNNAGFGVFGKFDNSSLDRELEMINVNIRALHILTKLFLKDFKFKDNGYILNVSSSAGFMTGTLLASYYASKNYV